MTFLCYILAYYAIMFIVGSALYIWKNFGKGVITFGEVLIIGVLTPCLLIFVILVVVFGTIFGAISSILNFFK